MTEKHLKLYRHWQARFWRLCKKIGEQPRTVESVNTMRHFREQATELAVAITSYKRKQSKRRNEQ